MSGASDWIERLQLAPHPEGGFYRETYRATGRLTGAERNTLNGSRG